MPKMYTVTITTINRHEVDVFAEDDDNARYLASKQLPELRGLVAGEVQAMASWDVRETESASAASDDVVIDES